MQSKQKKYYLYVLVTSLLSMAIALSIIYCIIRKNLINKSIGDNVEELDNVISADHRIFDEAENAAMVVASDSDIADAVDGAGNYRYTDLSKSYTKLINFRNQYEFSKNFRIHYHKAGKVLATEWGISSESMFLSSGGAVPQYNKNGLLVLSGADEASDLAYCTGYPLSAISTPKIYISLILDTKYLKEVHEKINSGGSIFSLDNMNHVNIYKSGKFPPKGEEGKTIKILKSGKTSSSSIQRYGGKKYLSIQIVDNKYNLIYHSMVSMKDVTSESNFIVYTLFGLITAIIIVLLFVCMYAMKKVYDPIELLSKMISRYDHSALMPPPTELVARVSDVLDKNQEMSKQLKENKQVQKQIFLTKLIRGDVEADDTLSGSLDYYDIQIYRQGLLVVLVCSVDDLSNCQSRYTTEEINTFTFVFMKLADQFFAQKCLLEAWETLEKDIIIIISSKDLEHDKKEFGCMVMRQAEKFHKEMTEKSGIGITIGVSGVHDHASDLAQAFDEAKCARDQRWLYGSNQIIVHKSGEAYQENIVNPQTTESKILTCLRENKEEQTLTLLAEFYDITIQASQTSMEMFRFYYLHLLSDTYHCLHQVYTFCLSDLPDERQEFLKLSKADIASEMNEMLVSLYRRIFDIIVCKRFSKRHELITGVIDYIDTNYAQELSADSIAEKFYISGSLLRKIFKSEMNQSVKVYIDHVRIESAKKDLCNPSLNINQIASRNGFLSVQTFIRIFKKTSGSTPSEFRQKMAI